MSAHTSPMAPVLLYDAAGKPMAVQNGVAIPANTKSYLWSGADASGVARTPTIGPSSVGTTSADNAMTVAGGAVKSAGNSTNVAGVSFTGAGENVTGYAGITVKLYGLPDTPSTPAAGTLFFEFSDDNVNWDVSVPLAVPNPSVFIPYPLRPIDTFFRIRWVQGSVVTTTFRLVVLYHRHAADPVIRTASQVLGANDPVQIVRAIVEPSIRGKFDFIAADKSVASEGIVFPFIGQIRAEFDAPFANNAVTVTTSGAGTATQTAANGAVLATGSAGAATTAKITSNTKVRYRPGREFRAEFSAGFPSAGIANSTILWGLSDESGTLNRLCVGYVGTVFGFHIYSGGAITTIPRASWNGDPLDGGPFSEYRLNNAPVPVDFTKAQGWRIRGKWFGVGPVLLEIQNPDDGSWIIAHTFRNTNIATTPYLQSPNMFIFAEATKVTGAAGGVLQTFGFSWAGGTVEDGTAFELHEVQSRTLVNTSIIPQTASFTAYTVGAGRQLYIKSMNINVVNSSLTTVGRLDITDATAGSAGTVLHSFTLSTATSASASSVTQPMAMVIPLRALVGIRFLVVGGTLTFAGSFQGYEKEL